MPKDKSNAGRTYHMIDSIKGGCGKTTLSIVLAHYLQIEQNRALMDEIGGKSRSAIKAENIGTTCLLDMDFYGTGMINLFYAEKDIPEAFSSRHVFIDERIRGLNSCGKKYICDVKVGTVSLHVGFVNPSVEAKEVFRRNSKLNYVSPVQYGTYRNGLKNIFKKGELESQIETELVKNIVLDMAPGTDLYSEALKDCIFDRNTISFLRKNDKRNYYLMVGMDKSQLVATESYLMQMFQSDDALPDRLFIVFNDIMQVLDEKERVTLYNTRRQRFDNIIGKQRREFLDRVFYLVMSSHVDYAKYIQAMHYLSEMRTDVFPTVPFHYGARYGEEFKEIVNENEYGYAQTEVLKWLIHAK